MINSLIEMYDQFRDKSHEVQPVSLSFVDDNAMFLKNSKIFWQWYWPVPILVHLILSVQRRLKTKSQFVKFVIKERINIYDQVLTRNWIEDSFHSKKNIIISQLSNSHVIFGFSYDLYSFICAKNTILTQWSHCFSNYRVLYAPNFNSLHRPRFRAWNLTAVCIDLTNEPYID